jgi:hypothetical protein
MIRRFEVTVVTDGAGAATAYTPYLSGYVHTVEYVKTDYTDGVDFTITAEATGETIWTQADVNAAAVKAPRQATHSTAGVAALYAAGGVAVNERVALGRDRIKIVLAQGGATKTGKFIFIIAD